MAGYDTLGVDVKFNSGDVVSFRRGKFCECGVVISGHEKSVYSAGNYGSSDRVFEYRILSRDIFTLVREEDIQFNLSEIE